MARRLELALLECLKVENVCPLLIILAATISINIMITLQSRLSPVFCLQNFIYYSYRKAKKLESKSFTSRIRIYNRSLDYFNRVFLMRPPNLSPSNPVSFPLKMPMLVRHIPKRTKNAI